MMDTYLSTRASLTLWTIPLQEAASLFQNLLPSTFSALTLLSLNVFSQKL